MGNLNECLSIDAVGSHDVFDIESVDAERLTQGTDEMKKIIKTTLKVLIQQLHSLVILKKNNNNY